MLLLGSRACWRTVCGVASHAVAVLLFSMWHVEGCRWQLSHGSRVPAHATSAPLSDVAGQHAACAGMLLLVLVGLSVAGSGLGIDVTPVPSRFCCFALLC
jgi:hypothetical protein